MRIRDFLVLIALAGLAGCTRSFPSTFPRSAAASLDAPEAPAIVIGRALREEPPLPGEPMSGWESLEAAPPQGGHVHAH
jgi:hypothetical protein